MQNFYSNFNHSMHVNLGERQFDVWHLNSLMSNDAFLHNKHVKILCEVFDTTLPEDDEAYYNYTLLLLSSDEKASDEEVMEVMKLYSAQVIEPNIKKAIDDAIYYTPTQTK